MTNVYCLLDAEAMVEIGGSNADPISNAANQWDVNENDGGLNIRNFSVGNLFFYFYKFEF